MGILKKFKNRLWFNFRIKKNEFHPSLDTNFKKLCQGGAVAEKEWERVGKLRQLAHEMEMTKEDNRHNLCIEMGKRE